jgi:hypothetical protein
MDEHDEYENLYGSGRWSVTTYAYEGSCIAQA